MRWYWARKIRARACAVTRFTGTSNSTSISRGKAFFSITACSSGRGGQGALPGYAHLGDAFNGRRGLALDVPFGLVDFIEASKADA